MLLAWTSLAFAQHRDPLPALPVERPVVLPRGWALLEAGVERDETASTLRLSARYAAMRRVELRVAVPIEWTVAGSGPAAPTLGARFRLHRSEPPNRSLALDLAVRTPAAAPVTELGLVGGAQAGPFLGTLRVAITGLADHALAEPALLFQVGPLFPFATARVDLGPDGIAADGVGGLGLQLNRAVAVRGWLGSGRAGLSLEVGA